jgi:hypothetical protein
MTVEKHTFKAVLIKHQHEHELRVTGEVVEPTTSWTVKLERANPQGINPEILLLKLEQIRPTGPAGDVVTAYHVKYDEKPVKGHYKEVDIEGHFMIPVT